MKSNTAERFEEDQPQVAAPYDWRSKHKSSMSKADKRSAKNLRSARKNRHQF